LEKDAGGRWGIELKKAGFDGLVIQGKAEKPVYIIINNKDIKILDAIEFWGLDTYETSERITEKYGKNCGISCIGPAGEKQVLLANIVHDGKNARTAGRGGLGAVMGSKNLKAVVVSGDNKVLTVDKDGLIASLKDILPKIIEKTLGMKKFGTAGIIVSAEEMGDLPIKNWKQGNWKDVEKISGFLMAETILKRRYYCGSCSIGCGREVEINKGAYVGVKGAGPEYETLGMLGSCCLINDLEAVAYINELCNRLGLDTISVGGVIAFAMELYEHKMITKKDLEGMDLTWGNVSVVIELVKKIGNSEGIGKFLGKGVKKIADEIGGKAQDFAIHTKGLEFPAHDPRAYNSLAVGYATSNRGACHLQGASYFFEKTVIMPEIGYKEPQDRFGIKGKGRLNYYSQNIMCIMDSLKLCKFLLFGGVNLTDMAQWIRQVTGWDFTIEELLQTGERIFNLKRIYNVRCGISRKDDTIPVRILTQPRRDKGAETNLPPLEKMLDEYYKIRGWTDEGIPKKATLKRLGLF